MNAAASPHDIPEAVLDQAFRWAVVLNSGTAGPSDRQAFDTWLNKDLQHQTAWQRIQMIEQEFTAARSAAKPGLKALKQVARQRQRKRRVAMGLGSLFSAMLLFGLLFGLAPMRYQWQAQYVTATGEQQHIGLASGAHVYLNSHTAVDIENTPQGALVRLYQGEILVDSSAAAASDKPRIVTADARLTPIGTRFLVQKRDETTELTVTEGLVALEPVDGDDDNEVRVKAGERWQVTGGQAAALRPSGLRPGAWIDGIVEADNARLGDVLDALDKHRRGWLRYDAAAADLRVTGIFRLDDTDSALRALERSLPVRIDRITDWWVTMKAVE